MDKYQEWYREISRLRVSPGSDGTQRIYKPLLLLVMLQRGKNDWFKPISPEEVAPDFFSFLMDNEEFYETHIKGDKSKSHFELGKFEAAKKTIIYLIKNMPMTKWGNNDNEKFGKYDSTKNIFWIDIEIEPENLEKVYNQTLHYCKNRINDLSKTNKPINFNIKLTDEYEKIYNESLIINDSFTITDRETLVKTRIGQGKFRNRLIERYGNCLVTNLHNRDLLVASHIKPWSDSNHFERCDVNNGLLLSSNIDKLFDKGLISFDTFGNMLVSSKISSNDREILQLSTYNKLIFSELNHQTKDYLEYHRNNKFNI